VGAFTSPFFELPHALIEPSALRIAKAFRVEPRFIQMQMPLLPLKPMVQSQHGVNHQVEAKTHPMYPLTKATPRFTQINMPFPTP
jgi:hypothetical protein